jgi:hypothetical protein
MISNHRAAEFSDLSPMHGVNGTPMHRYDCFTSQNPRFWVRTRYWPFESQLGDGLDLLACTNRGNAVGVQLLTRRSY